MCGVELASGFTQSRLKERNCLKWPERVTAKPTSSLKSNFFTRLSSEKFKKFKRNIHSVYYTPAIEGELAISISWSLSPVENF